MSGLIATSAVLAAAAAFRVMHGPAMSYLGPFPCCPTPPVPPARAVSRAEGGTPLASVASTRYAMLCTLVLFVRSILTIGARSKPRSSGARDTGGMTGQLLCQVATRLRSPCRINVYMPWLRQEDIM